MSRPQIGIDRLPARRMSNEPREAMNCKSCRKRKIKCNRLKPSCEACQVFACPCIYDAVPKKRGPKTDVLEALLKRVDGLEKRLVEEKRPEPSETEPPIQDFNHVNGKDPPPQRPLIDIAPNPVQKPETSAIISPIEPSPLTPSIVPDILLDTYFARLHGKPYYILDELSTRQRLQNRQLPNHLASAIYAVSARYATHYGGYNGAVRMGHEYARRSRLELDIDEPSIEGLQTLLLLAQAAFQAGRGKKSYMLLSSGISMAYALELHRELPAAAKVSPAEREGRRRLFWACYLLDRFTACGSKRPSLVSDESIILRLPSWQVHPGTMYIEGDYFPNGSNLQYMSGAGRLSQGSTGMLIGIVRILGITNRYLAAGGVKGDSHFPWHSLSNLSKIRQDLDIWASETQDTFRSIEALFGQPDSTILVLSKLIYHLIHCLIYRPFLPVDLAELSGTGQHQSWQIEATNLCFLHANAIAELVEIGRASSIIDWPAFVGYCVCTAGTIHVHGAHYRGREGEVFSTSAEFLSREMHQLSELRFLWAGVQHQRETLQTIYGCHSELVKSLASNPMRFSPVFQLEDFFDRYPGQAIDGAHVTFSDVTVDAVHERLPTYNFDHRENLFMMPSVQNMPHLPHHGFLPSQQMTATPSASHESRKKRRTTNPANSLRLTQLSTPTQASGSVKAEAENVSTSAPAGQDEPKAEDPPISLSDKSDSADMNQLNSFSPNMTAFAPSPTFNFASLASGGTTEASEPTATSQDIPPSHFDSIFGVSYEQQTTPGSTHTDPDKDPFLTLLEQLAENDAGHGGPSELDLFLSGTG